MLTNRTEGPKLRRGITQVKVQKRWRRMQKPTVPRTIGFKSRGARGQPHCKGL